MKPCEWRNTPAGATSSQKLRNQSSAWKIINHKDDPRFWCSVLHQFAHVPADAGHSWKQQGCEVVSSNLVLFYTCWAQSYRTSSLVYICSSHFIATFNRISLKWAQLLLHNTVSSTFMLLCQQTQGEQNVPKPSHKFRSRKFESQGNLLNWLSVGTYIQEPITFTPWPFCFLPCHRIIESLVCAPKSCKTAPGSESPLCGCLRISESSRNASLFADWLNHKLI